jgi:hypothetical protein
MDTLQDGTSDIELTTNAKNKCSEPLRKMHCDRLTEMIRLLSYKSFQPQLFGLK